MRSASKGLDDEAGIDKIDCVPQTPEWLAYWKGGWQRYVADEPGVRFTIDAMRATMRDMDDDDEGDDDSD